MLIIDPSTEFNLVNIDKTLVNIIKQLIDCIFIKDLSFYD